MTPVMARYGLPDRRGIDAGLVAMALHGRATCRHGAASGAMA